MKCQVLCLLFTAACVIVNFTALNAAPTFKRGMAYNSQAAVQVGENESAEDQHFYSILSYLPPYYLRKTSKLPNIFKINGPKHAFTNSVARLLLQQDKEAKIQRSLLHAINEVLDAYLNHGFAEAQPRKKDSKNKVAVIESLKEELEVQQSDADGRE